GTLAVTRRYYDPYGNQIGTPPSSWPGDRGFVGGTTDAATGLTNLGAREYNPVTGAFISPDPLITPYHPQDLNPYAYAGDSPATNSDPSGALWGPGMGPDPCSIGPPHCGRPSGGGGNGGYGRTSPPPWDYYGQPHDVRSPLIDGPPPVTVTRTVR